MKLFFNRNILVLLFFVIGLSILVSYKQTEHMTNNNGNKLIDDAKNIDLKFNNNIKKLFGDQVNKVNKNNANLFLDKELGIIFGIEVYNNDLNTAVIVIRKKENNINKDIPFASFKLLTAKDKTDITNFINQSLPKNITDKLKTNQLSTVFFETLNDIKNIQEKIKIFKTNKNVNDQKNIISNKNVKNNQISVNCPKVYMRGNNYFVYINPQSKYAKSIGSGEFPYGSDRNSAKRIFELNFPDCKVPDLFKYGHRSTKLDKNCPFKVKMGNPCLSYQCSGVDFSKDTTIKNNECKRVVNHYCELNKDIDDSCMCWKKENRNNPTCARKRRDMKHPDDFHCNINYFKITEHPDLKNYVRKDKIPCWSCDMNEKNIDKKAERTWDRVKKFL